MTKKIRNLSARKSFFIYKFDFFIRIAPGIRLLQPTINMSNSGMISNFRFQCPEVKFNLWRKAWGHQLKLRSHSMQSKPSNQSPLPSCISSCNTIIRNEKYMRVREREKRLTCNDLPHWFCPRHSSRRKIQVSGNTAPLRLSPMKGCYLPRSGRSW